MKLTLYLFYALALFNVYVYILIPEFVIQELWKWDIFIVMLLAPLIYSLEKSKP